MDDVRSIVETVRAGGFEPVFVHHSFHPSDVSTDDAAYVAGLAGEMGVRATASMGETVAAYAGFSFAVSMRLHS